jgi:hypothetical protein
MQPFTKQVSWSANASDLFSRSSQLKLDISTSFHILYSPLLITLPVNATHDLKLLTESLTMLASQMTKLQIFYQPT